ncbi:MAG: MltA domain-containing protein [Thermoanaerobaculia bacterium]|nr:MltA domain-containing protein [Thermoanaerobaculia bacterium]
MPAAPRRTSIAWPLATLLASSVAAVALSLAIWCLRGEPEPAEPVPPPPEPAEERLLLLRSTFADLPGWTADPLREARPAIERSCSVWSRRDPTAPIATPVWAGRVADWSDACAAVAAADTPAALRQALERYFTPWAVRSGQRAEGLFTGYYEPLLDGSRQRSERFDVPLYRKPDDIVEIDLERFHDRFEGQTISGRLTADSFEPYYERAEITAGALAGRGLELVWVDDAVEAFFLHIQGSGRVRLAEGGEMRVGYAGQNGRPYYAIGRELVARGAMTLEEVSLQSIRAWLAEHPSEAHAVMAVNPSYIFFRELDGEGPIGSLGVPLTPRRSLAVDATHLPLGAPLWLDATAPRADGSGDAPLRRLMVAQDTGGAIRGAVRGDVFWGHGAAAEAIAGRMKHPGRLWVLLPRGLDPATLPIGRS